MMDEWGWGPFMSPEPLNSTSYTFTIPLSTFAAYLPGCGENCDAAAVEGWFFALHASADDTCGDGSGNWSATAWDPACRVNFIGPNGKPHFKSYDTCSLVFPACESIPGDPGGEGTERCETAWGFDMSSPGEDDGVPATVFEEANEAGWFEIYFGDPTAQWGWAFRYQVD
jgi:hypothetical protein